MSKNLAPETQLAVQKAIDRGMGAFMVIEPLPHSDWADTYFYLSTESSGVAGPWETLPYQRGPMNATTNDDIRTLTWMKCARIGYTKMLVSAIGYFAVHKKRNVVIYQPTDSDAADFTKDEIDTMIRDCPDVGAVLKSDPEKRSKSNTLSRKEFLAVTLDIKGGKSARNYRRLTKDVSMYDEADGFDVDIDREGSCFELGDIRTLASPFRKSIRGSTPGIKGISIIEQSFNEADLQLYRFLPCPNCGEYYRLEFGNMECREEKNAATVEHLCPHCSHGAIYENYPDMDEDGYWMNEDQSIYLDDDDIFYDKDGKEVKTPKHVAFFIWGGYSYFMTWEDMMDRWFLANNAIERTGDNTKLKTFVNTVLAETWDEDPGEVVEWEEVKARAEDYEPFTIPMGGLLLVASVDTQNDRLALLITAYGKGETSWRIHYEELIGDPAEKDVWEQLDGYLDRTYTHVTGELLTIACCAIDSGGSRTQAVYRYVRGRNHQCIAIKGASSPWQTVLRKPTAQDVTSGGKVHKGGVNLWMVGSDTAKATIYRRMKLTGGADGQFHTHNALSDDYFKQVTGEKLTTRYKRGFPYQEFIKLRRNEAIDCEAYAYAAAIKAGLFRINWDARLLEYQANEQFRSNTGRDPEPTTVYVNRPQTKADSEYL